MTPTPERLRELLDYHPGTGLFTWRVRPSNRVRVGAVAGSRHGAGYVQINVDGENFLAHRLVWLHAFGHWPAGDVDHINGERTDNRFINLRDVPKRVNNQNIRRPMSTNTSGLLGASWSKRDRCWRAEISIGGRTQYIGNFGTKESAHAAYLEAKRAHHVGCTI